MAVVLLSPVYGEPKSFDYLIPNPGVAMLAASLEKDGHDVTIYDPNLPGESLDGIVSAIRERSPDLVGLSVYHNGFLDAVNVAGKIRKASSKTKIAAGGPQITTWEEKVYEITGAFDVLGIGEGERTIQQLADWSEGNSQPHGIAGVIYRNGSGIHKTSKLYQDLADLPEPAWYKFDLKRYLPILTLELGRGCPWSKCSFCVHGHISGKRRERPIDNVIEELKNDMKKYHVSNFRITDSSPSYKDLEEFSQKVHDRWYTSLRWCTLVRANQIDEKLAKKMADAGCVSVFVGAESGSNRMLELMNKGETVEQNAKAIRAIKSAGIKVAASNIIGFPGESEASIDQTVGMMNSTRPDAVMYYPLGVLPKTALSANPEEYGIHLHDDWQEKMLKTKIKLIGGRPDPLHYFDYDDGKPNTYYWDKVGKIIKKNAIGMLLHKQSIQLPEHVYLLSEMLPRTTVDKIVDGIRLAGTREMRLVKKFQKYFDNNDQKAIDTIIEEAWEDSRQMRS